MKILDRYFIREVVLPSLLALLVLTFVLEIPPILREGEQLIAKGVELSTVAHVLLTLLPQAPLTFAFDCRSLAPALGSHMECSGPTAQPPGLPPLTCSLSIPGLRDS